MIAPRLEREAELAGAGNAGAKGGIQEQARRRAGRRGGRDASIMGGAVTNALEPSASGGDMGQQHRLDPVAQTTIGVADDAGTGLEGTRGALGGDRGHEF